MSLQSRDSTETRFRTATAATPDPPETDAVPDTPALPDVFPVDANLTDEHSLAAIWTERRIGCPDEQSIEAFLAGTLDEGEATAVRLHLEVVRCEWCRAIVADLRGDAGDAARRRAKILASSAGRLGG